MTGTRNLHQKRILNLVVIDVAVRKQVEDFETGNRLSVAELKIFVIILVQTATIDSLYKF